MSMNNQAHTLNWLGWLWGNCLLRWLLAGLLAAGLGLTPLSAAAAAARLNLTITGVDASAFPRVSAYLTVVNENGYPVLGLNTSDFEVTEEGTRGLQVEVTPMVNSQEPLAVTLVVDVSGSMDGQSLEDAKNAAATFITALAEQDQGSLMAFSTKVQKLQDFTRDKGVLLGSVSGLQIGGNTALYDALFAAVDAASQSGIARRIVVLETDGHDTSSKASLDDGINLARQRGVPVYTVGLGTDVDKNLLSRIANSTGGAALFAPTSSGLEQAYRTISDQLRNQYLLKYLSPAPKGVKSYRLAVKINQLLDRASAETTFAANPSPPAITSFSLADGAVVADTTTVTVEVKSASPVTEVRLEANGRRLAQSNAAPYTFTLNPRDYAPGRQQVTVVVTNGAGSSASKSVWMTVPLGATAGGPPEAAPAAQNMPTLPDLGLGTKLAELAQAILAKPQEVFQAVQSKAQEVFQAAQSKAQDVMQGIVDTKQQITQALSERANSVTLDAQRMFTVEIPALFLHYLRSLLLLLVLLAAASVAVFEIWKVFQVARTRLQRVCCPQCQTMYRAFEKNCPRCWLEQTMAQHEDRTLGVLLVDNGLLKREDLELCLSQSAETKIPLDTVLAELDLVTSEQLAQARFYLEHSTEMALRKREMMATRVQERLWDTGAFAPHLAFLLLAVAVGGASLPQMWS